MKGSFIFLFFVFISYTQGYEKLSKYSSVSVDPNTKVYLDISGFETGEIISLEFEMDLFFCHNDEIKKSYPLQIDQVAASSYVDSKYWTNLRKVYNGNVTHSSRDYTFTWDEIKQEGKNYIFIIPSVPFDDFTWWGNKIKIRNTGGLSAGEIALIIIFGVITPIIIIAIIIYCCCCRKRVIIINNYTNTNTLQPQPVPQPVPQPAYQQPTYQPPYQQPVYQPPYQQPVQPAYQEPGYERPYYEQQPASQQPPY